MVYTYKKQKKSMRLNSGQEEAVYYAIRYADYKILTEALNKIVVTGGTPSIIRSMIRNANYHLNKAKELYPSIDAMELQKGIIKSIEKNEIADEIIEKCKKYDTVAPELEWCLNHYEKKKGCSKIITLEIILHDLKRSQKYFNRQHPLVKSRVEFIKNIAKFLLDDLTATASATTLASASASLPATTLASASATTLASASATTLASASSPATTLVRRRLNPKARPFVLTSPPPLPPPTPSPPPLTPTLTPAPEAEVYEKGEEEGLDEDAYEEIMAKREALGFM